MNSRLINQVKKGVLVEGFDPSASRLLIDRDFRELSDPKGEIDYESSDLTN